MKTLNPIDCLLITRMNRQGPISSRKFRDVACELSTSTEQIQHSLDGLVAAKFVRVIVPHPAMEATARDE